jgi:aspartyl-tRNA(Asn)/glutamyl-tRNA(Gln) amidotransferase subunit B
LIQETRHWDEEAGLTHSMRTKEGSSDYRYFVEPDLVPMVMDPEWVTAVRESIPELPAERRARYMAHGLERSLAGVVSGSDPSLRGVYEDAVAAGADSRAAANWVTGELTGWARKNDVEPADLRLSGEDLAELVGLIGEGVISSSAAKEVLDGVLSGEGSPREIAEARDLIQITDTSALESAVREVLAANPVVVEEYRSGERKVVGFLVGQVMKATQGKADPKAVNHMLRAELDG